MILKNAVKQYLVHCEVEKKLSPKSIKAYKIDYNQFCSFLDDSYLITNISKEKIREFMVYISHHKPKTIRRKLASIKALFNFLEYEDLITINPFRKVKIKIKDGKTIRTVMDINEIKSIFKKAYNFLYTEKSNSKFSFFEKLRNIVILELLFNTGCRVSEISNLKASDINIKNGLVTFLGKGNKVRQIQVCNAESMRIIKQYHEAYREKIIEANDWLLVNRLNNRLSEQSIRNIVKNVTKNVVANKKITPHIFRHTFATLLLENNVDVINIQSFLGHSSVTTTQLYTHTNLKTQRRILLNKHPRKSISFLNQ